MKNLSINEAAKILGVSRPTVYWHLSQGKAKPSFKRVMVIPEDQLRALAEAIAKTPPETLASLPKPEAPKEPKKPKTQKTEHFITSVFPVPDGEAAIKPAEPSVPSDLPSPPNPPAGGKPPRVFPVYRS